jgi:hypothetical protein
MEAANRAELRLAWERGFPVLDRESVLRAGRILGWRPELVAFLWNNPAFRVAAPRLRRVA